MTSKTSHTNRHKFHVKHRNYTNYIQHTTFQERPVNLVITVLIQTKACKVEQEKHSPKQKLNTLATPTSKSQTAETPRKTENTPKTRDHDQYNQS